MTLERLLPLLCCLECGDRLHHEENNLICQGCGEVYAMENDIPVMVRKDKEDEQWEEYFHRISSRMGDTEAANRYFHPGNFRFVRASLLGLIGPVKEATILDVGCGTGHFSQSLARDNFVVGVDISLAMLGFARKKGLVAVHSSGKKLPFNASSFDLVIANNIIQSIQEGGAFVHELSRVARPGGKLLISTTNGENFSLTFLRSLEKGKHRRLEVYSVDDLTLFCAKAGCPVDSTLFLFFPFGLVKKTRGDSPASCLARRLSTTLAVLARKLEKELPDD